MGAAGFEESWHRLNHQADQQAVRQEQAQRNVSNVNAAATQEYWDQRTATPGHIPTAGIPFPLLILSSGLHMHV